MSASCYSECLKEGGGSSSIHQSKQSPLSVLQPESGSEHLKKGTCLYFFYHRQRRSYPGSKARGFPSKEVFFEVIFLAS